jgi:hypothetical protein
VSEAREAYVQERKGDPRERREHERQARFERRQEKRKQKRRGR